MNKRLPSLQNNGFSLIELLLVLVILALVSGLVVTSVSRSINNAKIRAASKDLVAAMRYTRGQSILSREEQRLLLNIETKSYIIPVKNKTVELPKELEMKVMTAESELDGESTGAIRFFPDGSSTGGRITLIQDEREWVIAVAWLTGEINVLDQDDD